MAAIQLFYKCYVYTVHGSQKETNSDGILVQLTFIEQTLLYAQGFALFVAFGLQDPVLAIVVAAWDAFTSGPCCLYLASFRRSFSDWRLSISNTSHSSVTFDSNRESLRGSIGPSDGAPRRGLQKNRFTSKSHPADISKLSVSPVDAAEIAAEASLLQPPGRPPAIWPSRPMDQAYR